jgi:hypothetical protein
MEDTYIWWQFKNVGAIKKTFTDIDLLPIREEVNEIYKDFSKAHPENNNLAGNIEHEYRLFKCKDYVETLISPYLNSYNGHFEYFSTIPIRQYKGENIELKLDKLWVNFQKKYEFNPIHVHRGVISFVLWLDVPYDIKDEMSNPSSRNSGSNHPGHFVLLFTNSLGQISQENIPVDKTYNNTMLMFSSKIPHCVYPFYTSDYYRISIAGNFVEKD